MQLFILQGDSVHQGSILKYNTSGFYSLHYDCELLHRKGTQNPLYIYIYIYIKKTPKKT